MDFIDLAEAAAEVRRLRGALRKYIDLVASLEGVTFIPSDLVQARKVGFTEEEWKALCELAR